MEFVSYLREEFVSKQEGGVCWCARNRTMRGESSAQKRRKTDVEDEVRAVDEETWVIWVFLAFPLSKRKRIMLCLIYVEQSSVCCWR